MMDEAKKAKWTSTYYNGDFYLIETWSGYRRSSRDLIGKQHILKPQATTVELGTALLDALAHSRFLSLDEIDDFFDYEKRRESYAIWIQSLMEQHNYKSKSALFKNMANCGVQVVDGVMEIMPMRHEKLEGWGREKDDGIENVFIPAYSSPTVVGDALLLAFSRCE